MLCQLRHVHEILIKVLDELEPASDAYAKVKVHAAPSAISIHETPSGDGQELVQDTNLCGGRPDFGYED